MTDKLFYDGQAVTPIIAREFALWDYSGTGGACPRVDPEGVYHVSGYWPTQINGRNLMMLAEFSGHTFFEDEWAPVITDDHLQKELEQINEPQTV